MHFCVNCGDVDSRYVVPRVLVEQQLGWKLDLPVKSKKAERQRQLDLEYDMVRLCRDCLLGILRLEIMQTKLLL